MRRHALALPLAILLVSCAAPRATMPPARRVPVSAPSVSPTLTLTATPVPLPSPSDTPSPSLYRPAPNTITTTCKPAPAPATDAQRYLYSILTPEEACFAFWIIAYESSWRVSLWEDPAGDGACGLAQARYCSKMARCAGYEGTACVPTPDWQTNWRGQINWFVWWVYQEMAPDPTHPSFVDGGTRYGSMAMAACHEWGCRTSDGALHQGVGWY